MCRGKDAPVFCTALALFAAWRRRGRVEARLKATRDSRFAAFSCRVPVFYGVRRMRGLSPLAGVVLCRAVFCGPAVSHWLIRAVTFSLPRRAIQSLSLFIDDAKLALWPFRGSVFFLPLASPSGYLGRASMLPPLAVDWFSSYLDPP